MKRFSRISNWGLWGCLTEQIGLHLSDYSSVTPVGRATFPYKGRLNEETYCAVYPSKKYSCERETVGFPLPPSVARLCLPL